MNEAPKRRWLRFSLKDLFVATTMISLGICGMVGTLQGTIDWKNNFMFIFGFWFACGGLIGAGLFRPAKKMALGAVIGFLLTWVLSIFLF